MAPINCRIGGGAIHFIRGSGRLWVLLSQLFWLVFWLL